MCIIVYKPRNVTISLDTLKTCFDHNPDGAGFMYPCENKVLIKKGCFSFSAFAAAWEISHKLHGDGIPVVFHFRISTSGRIDKTNCHPHRIAEDLAFVHNGILTCVRPPNKSKISDTIMYRDSFLKNFTGKRLKEKKTFENISSHIGKGNKFAFMNGLGGIVICNDDQGVWNDGIWYSNTSFRKRTHTTFLFRDDVCECCGADLVDPDERANGLCVDCLPLYIGEFDRCGLCGEVLTMDAEWDTGYCARCGATINNPDSYLYREVAERSRADDL